MRRPSTKALREILERAGAEVILAEGERGNPDAIYAYDPLLVGEQGAVLLRPGKDGRLGEPGALEADLERAGVPVAARIEAPGTIDGGDTRLARPEDAARRARLPDERVGRRAARAGVPRRRGCSPTTCRTGTAAPR